jgi:large subunit ribosomal protein L22
MADEKETKPKRTTAKKSADSEDKPKRTPRSSGTRKAAASKEEKPARAKSQPKAKAKAKADTAEKPATRRRTSTARAKEPAEASAAEAKAADAKAEAPEEKPAAKAPARKPAAKREAARPPRARPVVTARAKYVRSSARKARLVIDHVRGKPIAEARALLQHSPRGVARDLERLLNSAVANAENNHDLVGDDLLVKEIYADEGPTLKRFRARAQGRAYRIRKRTSHLTVSLTPKE